jgi:hypothetical protein
MKILQVKQVDGQFGKGYGFKLEGKDKMYTYWIKGKETMPEFKAGDDIQIVSSKDDDGKYPKIHSFKFGDKVYGGSSNYQKSDYSKKSGYSKGGNESFALSYAKDVIVKKMEVYAATSGAVNDPAKEIMDMATKFKEWLDNNSK